MNDTPTPQAVSPVVEHAKAPLEVQAPKPAAPENKAKVKAAVQPAAKTEPAAKTPRKLPTKTVTSATEKVSAKVPAQAPAKVQAKTPVKAAVKARSKPVAAAAARVPAKDSSSKPVKVKLLRDSFTMPSDEYAALGELKQRALASAHPVKKSELIRAGIKLLKGLNDAALLHALKDVPAIKTGRPKAKKVD